MIVRTVAPAKINWTLEVLGSRPDGYHEIRSVMQTIDLCEEVTLEASEGLSLDVSGDHSPSDDDHTLQAARLLRKAVGRDLGAAIHVNKRTPVGAGLGGGSSDAGAVLRGLRALHALATPDAELSALAAGVGSDAPFFVRGGTALGSGRGEQITPLADAAEAWLVVLAPPISMPDKTRRMYATLEGSDFTDGQRTAVLAERLRQGDRVRVEDLYNAFEGVAYESFAGLAAYRERLLEAGAAGVHLAGAGPALFAVFGSRAEADGVAGRLGETDARVFVARTLGAEEATRVEVS